MLFMYVCAYVSVHIYAVSAKVRREDQIPWNRSLDGLNHRVGVGKKKVLLTVGTFPQGHGIHSSL